MEQLKAEGNDTIIWDGDMAGFGVRVYTTGRNFYIVQSRETGPKRAALRRVGNDPFDEHRREAAVLIDRIKGGAHRSTAGPEAAIKQYVETHNPPPFRWAKSANDLLSSKERFSHSTLGV